MLTDSGSEDRPQDEITDQRAQRELVLGLLLEAVECIRQASALVAGPGAAGELVSGSLAARVKRPASS